MISLENTCRTHFTHVHRMEPDSSTFLQYFQHPAGNLVAYVYIMKLQAVEDHEETISEYVVAEIRPDCLIARFATPKEIENIENSGELFHEIEQEENEGSE